MNDEELADAVVALGISKCLHTKFPPAGYVYTIPETAEAEESAGTFVRDWRVVGALMEKCLRIVIHKLSDGWTVTAINDRDEGITIFNESLPRAIIEACVKARS